MTVSAGGPQYYLRNPNLKNAGVKLQFTKEQIEEYIKCSQDIHYFINNYYKIIHVDHGLIQFKPFPFQEKIIDSVSNNRFVIAKIARQSGKALDISTPIPTPQGFKTMGELKVGDDVFGRNGEIVNVTYVSPIMNDRICYELKFDDGNVIVADAEHIWRVYDRYKRREIDMTTEEILHAGIFIGSKNKESRFSVKNAKAVSFEETNPLPIHPYILGYWLGDGDSASSRITHHVDDTYICDMLSTHGYEYNTVHDKRNINVCTSNVYGLITTLKTLGIASNKHIPASYMFASKESRIALLQGIMDSDGYGKNSTCEITLKNTQLVWDIKQLCESLGLKVKYKNKVVNNTIYIRLSFSCDIHGEFMPFAMPRKVERMTISNRHEFTKRFIKSITRIETRPVRCIQVSGDDNMYCAGTSFIPTHNTTIVAAILLWYVLFNENFSIALLAHKAEQSREIMSRIQLAFENLPHWLQQGVVEWNKGSIEFENHSKIIAAATSSGSVRGRTFNLVYLDEFAHVEPNEQEDFYTSVYPTISSGQTTKIIITSTPKGMELFHKIWVESEQQRNTFVRVDCDWREVPGRDEKWRKETIQNTSERQFSQEYETNFLGSTNTLLEPSTLSSLTWIDPIQTAYNENLKIYKNREDNHTYLVCVDTSEGLNQDYHAFIVFDVTTYPYDMVAMYRSNSLSHLLLPDIIHKLAMHYNEAFILCEVQTNGAMIASILLGDLEYENVLTTTLKGKNGQRLGSGGAVARLGVMMNKQVKRIGCSNLKTLIESRKLLVCDHTLIKEFYTFVADKQTFKAEEGKNDDLVMCCVLFAWAVSQSYFQEVNDLNIHSQLRAENEEMINSTSLAFVFVDTGHDIEEPINF